MMESRRAGFAELIVIGLVGAAVILGILLFSGSFGSDSTNQNAGQQEDGSTASVEASPTVVEPTAVPTEPESTATMPIDLPADAFIKTADEAISHALIVARDYLKADNPKAVSVEAMTLADALQENATQLDEDPALALEGLSPADKAMPVWRVVLGNAAFEIPRCPPSGDGSAERTSCGTGSSAIVTFEAVDGEIAQLAIVTKD